MELFRRGTRPARQFGLLLGHAAFRQISTDRLKRATIRPSKVLADVLPGDLLWATDNQGSTVALVVTGVEALRFDGIDDHHRRLCGFGDAAAFVAQYVAAFGDAFPDDPVIMIRWDASNPPSC